MVYSLTPLHQRFERQWTLQRFYPPDGGRYAREGEKIDFALVNAERLRREPQSAILNEHRHLHGLAKLGEVDCAELNRIHTLVVDEMTRRGLEHNSPLECGEKFSPDQPRDEHGRFGSGGGSGTLSGSLFGDKPDSINRAKFDAHVLYSGQGSSSGRSAYATSDAQAAREYAEREVIEAGGSQLTSPGEVNKVYYNPKNELNLEGLGPTTSASNLERALYKDGILKEVKPGGGDWLAQKVGVRKFGDEQAQTWRYLEHDYVQGLIRDAGKDGVRFVDVSRGRNHPAAFSLGGSLMTWNDIQSAKGKSFEGKPGLKLNEPHAYLVWKGKKKSIALPADDGKGLDGYLVGVPLVLCQNGAAGAEAYGEAILGNPAAMTPAQFDLPEYTDCHCVRPEERREWWDGVRQFYVYPIKSFARYDKPRPVLLKSGCKCYLPDVRFKQYTPPTDKERAILAQSEKLPKQIILTPRAVSLTGSMLYGNHEPRDVDMVVVGAEWREDEGQFVVPLSPTFKEKLERVLRAVYQTGNSVQYISEHEGPTFDHLPLYALALVRLPRLEVEHVSEMEPEMAEVGYDKDGAKGIRPAFGSPGGKRQLAHEIADLIPDCKTYVEPCVGGGAVFFAREPSGKEILGDLDPEIIRAYKAIKNLSDEDIAWLGKQDWKATKSRFEKLSEQPDSGRKEGLYRFLYMVAYSKGDRKSYRHWYDGDKIAIADRLPDLRERLKDVELISGDYATLVKKYDGPDTFFYFDPPYPNTSNLSEFDFDAERFEKTLKGIKGKAIVSWSPKSPKLDLPGWHTKRVTVSRSDQDKSSDTELLLLNFSGTKALTATAVERELRGASPATRRQALQSYTDDAVVPGRPFVPLKPMRPVEPSQRQTVDKLFAAVDFTAHPVWYSSTKRDGIRVVVSKNGDKVSILSDDGNELAGSLPNTVKAMRGLPYPDFVFDCECEVWQGDNHLPREAATAAVHTGDESDLVFNLFDLLYLDGKDLHRLPFEQRYAKLKELDLGKAKQLRVIEHRKCTSLAQLKERVMQDAYRPGSEGVVVKPADGSYDLDGVPTKAGWLKWHKNSFAQVVILAVNQTATPGVVNFTYGVEAGDLKPAEPFELNGKTYLVIGKSFSTSGEDAKKKPGDEIEIEMETCNLTENDDGTVSVSFWVPNVIKSDQKDSEDWRV